MTTQAKRDYYEVLGVTRTATDQEIKSAFQKLATDFHEAGKPKNIDDVEWLRVAARAYRVLSDKELRPHYDRTGDDSNLAPPLPGGYDQELIEKWEKNVDNQAQLGRNLMLMHFLGEGFGFF